ncbi:MAG: AmmeMemoRadiSam system protein B [Nitrospira sp.]|nr:AmmeMemoRadiSam system protein B [Nitrospira sp.]MCP9441130.1 AmmeMemoRadiSam system protein B [Nitrospira sp.]
MSAGTVRDPKQYPVLRNLQYSPIKQGEDSYIVLWDPSGLSQEKLVLPLNYFFIIQHFDGRHSLTDILSLYLKRFGEFLLPAKIERLVRELDEKLFLEGARAEAALARAIDAYRQAPCRKPTFAGRGYEADGTKLSRQIEGFFSSQEGPGGKPSAHAGKPIKGLVTPTYDLKQAGPIYAWAYKELREAVQPALYIILGAASAGSMTSPFAATDKDFETPLGLVQTDRAVLSRLRDRLPDSFQEDLCHQAEPAIEFQLPFLQEVVGREKAFTIVPILCSFSALEMADHELRQGVKAFLDGLQEILCEDGRPFCIIAAGELAHLGLRYGDKEPPTDFSFHRSMQRDLEMLKLVEELKADEFANFIVKEEDRRRISGFAPIYSLLRLIQAEKGEVLRYDRGITDQFNSTVTYVSMAFF